MVTESNTNDAPEKSAFALLGVMMPPFGAKANIGVLVEKSNPMTAGTMAAFWMENDSFVLMKKPVGGCEPFSRQNVTDTAVD